jgi:uncharacterized protein (DUF1697 family)
VRRFLEDFSGSGRIFVTSKKRFKRLMSAAEIFKSKSNEEEFCNTSMMSAGAEISSREKVVKNNFAYFNLFL